jgi:hypothetical protein
MFCLSASSYSLQDGTFLTLQNICIDTNGVHIINIFIFLHCWQHYRLLKAVQFCEISQLHTCFAGLIPLTGSKPRRYLFDMIFVHMSMVCYYLDFYCRTSYVSYRHSKCTSNQAPFALSPLVSKFYVERERGLCLGLSYLTCNNSPSPVILIHMEMDKVAVIPSQRLNQDYCWWSPTSLYISPYYLYVRPEL